MVSEDSPDPAEIVSDVLDDWNTESIGKERVYIDSPSDAPEGVQVQEGQQGGLYYETEQDVPEVPEEAVYLLEDLSAQFGDEVAQVVAEQIGVEVPQLAQSMALGLASLGLARKSPDRIVGDMLRKGGVDLEESTLDFSTSVKVWVDRPDQAPDDVIVHNMDEKNDDGQSYCYYADFSEIGKDRDSYLYPEAALDAPDEVQEVVEDFRQMDESEVEDTPLLYHLLGDGTPPYKMSKADSDYKEEPQDGAYCGNCQFLYYSNETGEMICSKVRGKVKWDHWCKLWKQADPDPLLEEHFEKGDTDFSNVGKEWVPYEGDRGGTGWQNTEDPDEIVYDDEPPGESLGLTQVLTDLADISGSDASAIMDELDEAVDALDLNEEGREKVYTEFAAKIVRDAARAGKPLDEFDPSQFLGYAGHVAEEFIEENRGEIDDKYIDDPYDDVPIEGPSQLAVGDEVRIDDLTGELVGVEQVNDPDYIDVDFGRGEPEEYFVSDIDEVVDISEREWSTSEISHADTQAINSIEGYQIQNDIEEVFGKFGNVTGKVEDRVLFDDDVDESDPMNWYEAVFDVTSEMDDVPKQKAQQFADTVDNRIKGTQLDDMDTREQLQNGFELYEERNDWYDVGSGGNTTGDQMEVLDMPDGSRQFAIPVNAYNRITTGVVRGPDEAVQNNLNAPKAIEALGGHAATTEVVQDPETGDDYIVKEGIPGYDVSEARKQGIDVAPGYREDAKATLAAAWFIGNGDLHYGNMRIAEDGRLVVIDHDSAGSDRMDPQDPETAPAGPPGIHSPDVSEKAIDIAAEIELGDMNLPDDIPMWMQDEIMKRVEGAIEYANNIGYDDLPEELQRETAADRGIDMTEDIDVGDLLEVQPEYLNRKVQGEVDRIEYGNLYIQDANGLEYEIENESEILELM